MYAWSSMDVILQLIYFIQLISHKISSQPVYLYRSIYYIKLISFSSIWNIIPIFRSSFNLSVPYPRLIKQWQQTVRGLHVQRVTIVTRSFAPRRLNFVSKQMKMCFSCVLIAVSFHTPWPEIPSQFLHLFGGKKSLMRRKPAPPPPSSSFPPPAGKRRGEIPYVIVRLIEGSSTLWRTAGSASCIYVHGNRAKWRWLLSHNRVDLRDVPSTINKYFGIHSESECYTPLEISDFPLFFFVHEF